MVYTKDLIKILVEQEQISRKIILANQLDIPNPREVSDNHVSSSINLGIVIAILVVILICCFPNFIKLFRRSLVYLRKDSCNHCLKCKFYNRNAYLSCAVHPGRVLTIDALNCQDFQSK